MSGDRKTPLWPWIAALLIGLPVLYVASFGPACWAVRHDLLTKLTAAHAYRPLIKYGSPPWLSRATIWYGGTAGDGFPVAAHLASALWFEDLELSGALRTSSFPPLNLDLRPH